jgi:hypothetical protein
MGTKYHQIIDGEWFRPKMRGFREQCCHCGLIHVIDYRIKDGGVEFRAVVDYRATAAARRHFNFPAEDDG